MLARAEGIERKSLPLDDEARASLVRMADGDGRAALTLAEEVWRAARTGEIFDAAKLQEIVQRRAPIYDKSQDGHYNLISALAQIGARLRSRRRALLSRRMLDAGEDPLYIARRVVRMAVEDIGLADPQALVICNAAKDAYDFLGLARRRARDRAGRDLCRDRAEIERRLYRLRRRHAAAKEGGSLLPPKHILNAPTRLMKSEGYGRGYDYDHERRGGIFRSGLLPGRNSAASSSTIRPNAVSSARSKNGWSIGRSCGRNGVRERGCAARCSRCLLLACAAMPASAQGGEERWALSSAACSGELCTRPETPLLFDLMSLRWFNLSCKVVSSYKVGQARHLQGQCTGDGRTATIPIMLELRGERLRVGWNREAIVEMQRCRWTPAARLPLG